MTVRANLILGFRGAGESEVDVFLQGEQTWKSDALIQAHILETVADMVEGDWITFTVIPADFSATDAATPLAYQGPKPDNGTLYRMGMDLVGYHGRCDSTESTVIEGSITYGKRCTAYRDHLGINEGADVDGDGVYHVDEDGHFWR